MQKNIILTILLIIGGAVDAQQLIIPNFAWATHPMQINKIERLGDVTVVELSITNQRTSGGSFCADKDIYIQDVLNGRKYNLLYSKGIPVCPDSYRFSRAGEVLTFQLYFPALDANTKYVNIVENCTEYCFRISGIILLDDFNKDINLGYQYYGENKNEFALYAFKKAIEKYSDYPYGKFYLNIIHIYAELGDFANAKLWYDKLNTINFVDKNQVMEQLQKAPYYNKLVF